MGGRFSRGQPVPQISGERANNPYRYPPPDGGNYFSSHFHLGYRKFPSGEPEVYLFGELNDINFLSPKPIAFPYKQPSKSEPVKCLHSYINLQRDSVKLVKSEGSEDLYHIEFMFDSDTDCQFTVYSFLPNTVELEMLRSSAYTNQDSRVSRPFHYSSGSEQQFVETGFTLAPGRMDEDQLTYDPENGQVNFPVAILMETDGVDDAHYQCQLTICVLDKPSDNGYTIKVLKQKLWVEGVEYLLQEIYGIENKSRKREVTAEGGEKEQNDGEEGEEEEEGGEESDDEEDLGAECVICITDVKDTILLPCRHLCLCSGCAANLRYQSSHCPICRAPFRALLQITALQPLDPDDSIDDDEATGNPEYAIAGYRSIPLLQALNGYTVREASEVGEVGGREEDAYLDEEEIESDGEQTQANRPERTTGFCVIPIDDEVPNGDVTSRPSNAQSPTSVQNSSLGPSPIYEVDENSIPLPGTPATDDPTSIQIKPSRSSSTLPVQSPLTVTVSVLEDGEEEIERHRASTEVGSQCGSSVSSQQSVKSTDALLS